MHLLVDVRFKIAHLLLNAGRQGGVVEAKSELDVAFLGAVRKVRTPYQQETVIDAEKLCVACDGALSVFGGPRSQDDGAAQLPGDLAGVQTSVTSRSTLSTISASSNVRVKGPISSLGIQVQAHGNARVLSPQTQ